MPLDSPAYPNVLDGLMLDKTTAGFISKSLKYSIKEYLPLNQRMLLLDVLYFLSIKLEHPQGCTEHDIATIKNLFHFCAESGIDVEAYVACAYNYIGKYLPKDSSYVRVSYLLNENVVAYCAKNVFGCTGDALIYNQVKSDVLFTEKLVRTTASETGTDTVTAVAKLLKEEKISATYLLYKVYMGQEPFASWKLSEPMQTLYDALLPIFKNMASKHGLFPANMIKEWSNSRIEAFDFCPIYFRDVYLTDLLPQSILGNEATEVGSKVHKVFEDIIGKYIKAKNKDIDAIYARHLTCKPFLEVVDTIEEHLPGIELFFIGENSLFKKYVKPDTKILIEESMAYQVEGEPITLKGIADLVLINGDEAVLIDYKTSKIDEKKWIDKNNAKYHKQLSLYAELLVKNFGVKSVTAILVYTRGLVHEFDSVNQQIIQERVDDIHRIKLAMKLNSFRANSASCFLCRHPDCPARMRESIWNPDGTRKPSKK